MNFEEQLDIYLRARFTLMVLVTTEEERALDTVKTVCERMKRPCLTWDVADGFKAQTGWSGALPSAPDAFAALEQVEKASNDALFVLKDFHEFFDNRRFEKPAKIKRKLRSLSQQLKFTKKSILITTPTVWIPEELKDEAVVDRKSVV